MNWLLPTGCRPARWSTCQVDQCFRSGEYRTYSFDTLKSSGVSGSWQTKEIGLTRNSTQNLYVIVEDSNGKTAKGLQDAANLIVLRRPHCAIVLNLG